MSHRALVAYRRGGPNATSNDGETARYDTYETADCGFDLAFAGCLGGGPDTDPVADRPVRTDVPLSTVYDLLASRGHEALFVVDEDLFAYRILRILVPTGGGCIEGDITTGRIALIRPSQLADSEPDGYLRGWWEATREHIGELVDRGVLSRERALTDLVSRLERFTGKRMDVIIA